jgi:plastocyanin
MKIRSAKVSAQLRASLLLRTLATVVVLPSVSAMAAPVSSSVVHITRSAFMPADITVAPGTRVTWINHDEIPHTVTSKDKVLASTGLDTNDRFEHVFDAEGDYSYNCVVHPFMTGIVHVRKP